MKAHSKRLSRPVESGRPRGAEIWLLCLSVVLTSVLSSCERRSLSASPVVAQVGEAQLTLDDIRKSLPADPGIELSRVQVERFVQQWIESELLYNEAVRMGVDKQPEVQQQLHDLMKEYIAASFAQQYADKNVETTDEEIQVFYQENASEFVYSEDHYHVLLILVNSGREAASIRSSLQLGQDFAEVARAQSLDGSRDAGGDLGWVTLNTLLPSIGRAVPYLPMGQVSQPIRTDLGYYLVQVLGVRKKGEPQSIEQVREVITQRIKAKKRQEEYRKLIAKLTEKANVRTDWDRLQTLVADSTLY